MSERRRKRRKKCSKKSKNKSCSKEIGIEEYRKKVLKFMNSPYSFLELNVITGISYQGFLRKRFFDLTEDEKIRRILHYDKRGRNELKKFLNCSSYSRLKVFFEEVFGKMNIRSKKMISQLLTDKFFDERSDVFKRDDEESNLENVNLGELQYVYMKGICVNVDILRKILSFVEYNQDLLFLTGSVCKGFYVTVLSTWPSVSVSGRTIYGISLLVLQRVKEIRITEKKSSERLNSSDLLYLMKNLSTNNLTRIIFRCSLISLKTYLRIMCEAVEKKKYTNPFTRVKSISFYLTGRSKVGCYQRIEKMKDESSSFWKKKNHRLTFLFPSITKFENPHFLPLLSNTTTLESLKLKILPSKYSLLPKDDLKRGRRRRRISSGANEAKKKMNVYESCQSIITRLYSIEKFRKYVPNTLKKLEIGKSVTSYRDSYLFSVCQYLQTHLECFSIDLEFPIPQQQELLMILQQQRKFTFDLSFLELLEDNLRELKVTNRRVVQYFNNSGKNDETVFWNHSLLGMWRSSKFFRSESILKMKSLQRLHVTSENLIDPEGVINILKNSDQLPIMQFRVMCFIREKDEVLLEELLSLLPRIENVHIELKVIGNQVKNPQERTELLDFYRDHLIFVDRSESRKTLTIGAITLNGLKGVIGYKWRERLKQMNNNGVSQKKKKFRTIECLVEKSKVLLMEGARKFRVVCKESEMMEVLDWSVLEDLCLKKRKMKDDGHFRLFDSSELDVNYFMRKVHKTGMARVYAAGERHTLGFSLQFGRKSDQKIIVKTYVS